jgi:hypothetical protein
MREYKSKSKREIRAEVNKNRQEIKDRHTHIDFIIKDSDIISNLYNKILKENPITKDGKTEIDKTAYKVFSLIGETHKKSSTDLKAKQKETGGLEKELRNLTKNAMANAKNARDVMKYISIPDARNAMRKVERTSLSDVIFLDDERKQSKESRLESKNRELEQIHNLAQIIAINGAYMKAVKPTLEREPPDLHQVPMEQPPMQNSEREGYIRLAPDEYKINDRTKYQKPH